MAGRLNFSKGQTPLEIANRLKRHKFLTGQGIGEYAIIIGVIISAIIAMQVYVQRGLQARYKAFTDSLTSSIHSPTQYEPYYTRSDFTVEQNAQSWERQWGKASVRRDLSSGTESSGTRSTEPGCASGTEGCPALNCLPSGTECGVAGEWYSEIPCCPLLSCQTACPPPGMPCKLLVCKSTKP